MVARTESTRGSLQPARAADANRPTAPASACARTSSFRRMGTSFVGSPGLRAAGRYKRPRELVNQKKSRHPAPRSRLRGMREPRGLPLEEPLPEPLDERIRHPRRPGVASHRPVALAHAGEEGDHRLGLGVQRVGRQRGEHRLVSLGRHQTLDDRLEVLLRRGVVGDDHLVAHAEEPEQHGRHDPGSILPRRAVVDDGPPGLAEDGDQARDRHLRDLGQEEVAVGERGDRRPTLGPRLLAVEERQVVEADRLAGERAAALAAQLGRGAEVDDRRDAELVAHARDVGRCEVMERVAAVDLLPADPASVRGGVAAQVAEVEAALQVDHAPHCRIEHTGRAPPPHALACGTASGAGSATMKLGLFLPLAGDPTRLRDMVATAATVAEGTGFHSLWFAEHVALFDTPASRYRSSADGSFPLTGEVGFVEPFVAIAFAAALTTRIRLGTGICLVPQRSPLYTAKQVADCDVLSGGRFDFGVGIGWLREEFEALGMRFVDRAARCREYLAAMRALWTEPVSRYEGKLLRVPPLRMFPKPIQKPHPPIVFGGEGNAALRRVADLGQGWYGFNLLPEEAAARVAVLDELLARRGRKPAEIEVSGAPYFKPARGAAALAAYAHT